VRYHSANFKRADTPIIGGVAKSCKDEISVALCFLHLPVSPDDLRDPALAPARKDKEYCARILNAMRGLLPDATQKELAEAVFSDRLLCKRLAERIRNGLERRGEHLAPEVFLDPEHAEASIVASCLLFRNSLVARQSIVDRFNHGV